MTVIDFLVVVVLVLTVPFLSTVCETVVIMMVTFPPPTNETLPLASTVASAGFVDEYVVDCSVYPLGAEGTRLTAVPALALGATLAAGTLPT